MKMGRRGVIALPIKLLIITVVLSLTLPMVMDAYQSGENGIDTEKMEREADRIVDAATAVYYSMNGATKMIEIDVPDNCYMVLGGENDDAYAIHMYCGVELTSEHVIEKPALSFARTVVIDRDCVLSISTTGNTIEVTMV